MRYVYTIFWHKNMLNFRLNKFHQRATAHISQAQCAWKCKRDTIIYLYLTTLTFTETRLLIWWVKLLNFLLFPVVFLKWTLPRTLHWFVNFVPRDSLPKLFAQLDIGWLWLTGANNHGGGGKPLVAFPGSTGNKLSSEVRRFGYLSGKLPTYPFPKPTLTLSSTREICFQSEPLFTKLQSIEFFRLVVTWSAYILEGGFGTWPKQTSSRHLKNTNKTEIKGKTD